MLTIPDAVGITNKRYRFDCIKILELIIIWYHAGINAFIKNINIVFIFYCFFKRMQRTNRNVNIR